MKEEKSPLDEIAQFIQITNAFTHFFCLIEKNNCKVDDAFVLLEPEEKNLIVEGITRFAKCFSSEASLCENNPDYRKNLGREKIIKRFNVFQTLSSLIVQEKTLHAI